MEPRRVDGQPDLGRFVLQFAQRGGRRNGVASEADGIRDERLAESRPVPVIKKKFLHSRVAWRIFGMFLVCTVVPIGVLAALSLHNVSGELRRSADVRLAQAGKTTAMAVMARLYQVDGSMRTAHEQATGVSRDEQKRILVSRLKEQFVAVSIVDDSESETLFGPPLPQHALTQAQHTIVADGGSALQVAHRDGSPVLLMAHRLSGRGEKLRVLCGEVDPDFLWRDAIEDALPAGAQLFVLDDRNRVVVETHPAPATLIPAINAAVDKVHAGPAEWKSAGEDYVGAYWSLFLQQPFGMTRITVVTAERRSAVLAPMTDFARIYAAAAAVVLLLAMLASVQLIRKSLVPLIQLKQATAAIAQGQFDTGVEVNTGDEFAELADGLNAMATRLGRQFNALTVISDIDREVLSTLDMERIVATLLSRMPEVVPNDGMCVALLEGDVQSYMKVYYQGEKPEVHDPIIYSAPPADECAEYREHREGLIIRAGDGAPRFLEPLVDMELEHFVVLPVFDKGSIFALIAIGFREVQPQESEDLARARQVAQQVAVAMSNARLIGQLEELHWGTLRALARAIDAKSPWTSGHSERVTRLALKIGQVLNLSDEQMKSLHRGGLLHDIGKIGISQAILDKPEALSKEEIEIMRDHVNLGARILEPIAAFKDALPIIRQHHEWYDGGGYPEGLSGDEIDIKARIFAVSDCFDSINSDRPYRSALGRQESVAFIWHQAGRQFDPMVVNAFMLVMGEETRVADGHQRSLLESDVVWDIVVAGRDMDE